MLTRKAISRNAASYKYILRYLICPTHHPEDRIEELARFCREAKVAEVMLLFTAEELTDGHPTIGELRPWVDVAVKTKARLAREGVTLSLNPWTTTFHIARGRRLKPGQDFTLMVGETGAPARITVCPLCEKWREYLCKTFAFMAKEVQPVALWVEDDWRLHNHEPEMKYGGCFCELHLKRFAKMTGRASVTRREVLDAILAEGRPHPWRKLWLDLWRDTLLEPAVRLRQAVRQACPATRLALMSSTPDIHSIEGRDWHALQDALGFEPEFLTRPHLPPYAETTSIQVGPEVTRMTLANLERPISVYPELESSPRCGIYSKSKTYTVMECLESVCYGSAGITINHFDMMGNGIGLDETIGAALAGPKDMLDAVAALKIDDGNAQGAAVLFSPKIAEYRHVAPDFPKEMLALRNQSAHWAQTLAILGIAYGFTQEPAKGRPVFVGDQTLRAFDDESIEELLRGVLICDSQSVKILIEKGMGQHIGIASVRDGALDELGYGYEEIVNGKAKAYGLDRPRMSASRCGDTILLMQPAKGAKAKTLIKTGGHARVGPGMVVYGNSLGGTIVSTAYPLGQSSYYMGYFNIFRQILWQDVLFGLCPNSRLAASMGFPLRVYRAEIEGGEFIGAINPTLDALDGPRLKLGNCPAKSSEIEMLSPAGQWRKGVVGVRQSGAYAEIELPAPIGPLKSVYLRIGRNCGGT